MLQENKICDMYLGGMSMQEVANEFKVSKTTVYRILKKNRIKSRQIYKLTIKERNEVAEKYRCGLTIKELSMCYKVCENNIRQILITRKIKLRTRNETEKLKSLIVMKTSSRLTINFQTPASAAVKVTL